MYVLYYYIFIYIYILYIYINIDIIYILILLLGDAWQRHLLTLTEPPLTVVALHSLLDLAPGAVQGQLIMAHLLNSVKPMRCSWIGLILADWAVNHEQAAIREATRSAFRKFWLGWLVCIAIRVDWMEYDHNSEQTPEASESGECG